MVNEAQMKVILDKIAVSRTRNVDNTEWVELLAQRAGCVTEILILQQTIANLDLKNEVEHKTYQILDAKVRKINAKIISINRKLRIY
jgi:hypothetical protein